MIKRLRLFSPHSRSILWAMLTFVLFSPLYTLADNKEEIEAEVVYAEIWQLDIQQAIGPASADWMIRSLQEANSNAIDLFIIRLNTPGGLDKSMRDIIQEILASSVPVAIYVYPKGARAASAGTYMLYAAHVAAMSPATNLGAATPVQIGSPLAPPEPERPNKPTSSPENNGSQKDSTKDQPTPSSTTSLRKKQINDAVAYIRSLASLHNRNAEWAEKAVREAASLEAEQALIQNVVDYIANNTEHLIQQLDGKTLSINNQPHKLSLLPFKITTLQPDWRHKILGVITDPSIAYILLMIGIYGLIFEFYNPGLGGPGILGAICLLTALYALQLLPISYAGLALIFLGIGLMISEAISPSVGMLGAGGVIAFIIGSVMLMDTDLPSYQIALPIITAMAVASVAVLVLVLNLALRSRKQLVVSGITAMIGAIAEALDDLDPIGRVRVQGEIWQAHSSTKIQKGDTVIVKSVNGLTLEVETRQ